MRNDFSQYVDKDSVMTLKGETKLEVMDIPGRGFDQTQPGCYFPFGMETRTDDDHRRGRHACLAPYPGQ